MRGSFRTSAAQDLDVLWIGLAGGHGHRARLVLHVVLKMTSGYGTAKLSLGDDMLGMPPWHVMTPACSINFGAQHAREQAENESECIRSTVRMTEHGGDGGRIRRRLHPPETRVQCVPGPWTH